jgi:hypothetical protein
MNDGSVSAIAAGSLVGAQVSSNAQPTAQQAARFEQQLHYEPPSVDTHGFGDGWHSLMDQIGQISKEARTGLDSFGSQDTTAFDLQETGLPGGTDQTMQMLTHLVDFSRSMMTVSLVSTSERVTIEGMRTLFQQQS